MGSNFEGRGDQPQDTPVEYGSGRGSFLYMGAEDKIVDITQTVIVTPPIAAGAETAKKTVKLIKRKTLFPQSERRTKKRSDREEGHDAGLSRLVMMKELLTPILGALDTDAHDYFRRGSEAMIAIMEMVASRTHEAASSDMLLMQSDLAAEVEKNKKLSDELRTLKLELVELKNYREKAAKEASKRLTTLRRVETKLAEVEEACARDAEKVLSLEAQIVELEKRKEKYRLLSVDLMTHLLALTSGPRSTSSVTGVKSTPVSLREGPSARQPSMPSHSRDSDKMKATNLGQVGGSCVDPIEKKLPKKGK